MREGGESIATFVDFFLYLEEDVKLYGNISILKIQHEIPIPYDIQSRKICRLFWIYIHIYHSSEQEYLNKNTSLHHKLFMLSQTYIWNVVHTSFTFKKYFPIIFDESRKYQEALFGRGILKVQRQIVCLTLERILCIGTVQLHCLVNLHLAWQGGITICRNTYSYQDKSALAKIQGRGSPCQDFWWILHSLISIWELLAIL